MSNDISGGVLHGLESYNSMYTLNIFISGVGLKTWVSTRYFQLFKEARTAVKKTTQTLLEEAQPTGPDTPRH